MSERYFITGTDIKIGETVASCALLRAARAVNYRTVGYELVVSSSEKTPEDLRNSDALTLQYNDSLQLGHATVNPYTLTEPTSSHIISTQEGRPIGSLITSTGLYAFEQQTGWVLVEGASGWFMPFSDTFTFADWVTQE